MKIAKEITAKTGIVFDKWISGGVVEIMGDNHRSVAIIKFPYLGEDKTEESIAFIVKHIGNREGHVA